MDARNPYRIEGPALISFSGGRTSAYMLRQILDAYDGELPADVHVTFANTGKERPETLDFVAECGRRWNIGVTWLERWPDGMREVSYGTAARAGEPFDGLISRYGFLPNPVMRFCTQELKVRLMRDYMRGRGHEHWTNVIGLRADEPSRVAKQRAANVAGKERWESAMPLAAAGVTEADVMAFWRRQPFDLQLRQGEGNCDLCFLKSSSKISEIMRARPDLATWWIEQEQTPRSATMTGKPVQPNMTMFRADRPNYASHLDAVQRQGGLDFGERDKLADCYCTE